VVSVATNETDGYHRFVRSLNVYGYKYEVFMIDVLDVLLNLFYLDLRSWSDMERWKYKIYNWWWTENKYSSRKFSSL
jgi:hypothetical protein